MAQTDVTGPLVVAGDRDNSGNLIAGIAGEIRLGSVKDGDALADRTILKKVVAIPNAVATAVLTVTVPNAAHAACLELRLLASAGAGGAVGANEAQSVAEYLVVISRTPGVATVAVASSAAKAASAIVAGGMASLTLAAAVSAITGGNTVAQTFTINVTITRASGSSDNHTLVLLAELMNVNGVGVTMA